MMATDPEATSSYCQSGIKFMTERVKTMVIIGYIYFIQSPMDWRRAVLFSVRLPSVHSDDTRDWMWTNLGLVHKVCTESGTLFMFVIIKSVLKNTSGKKRENSLSRVGCPVRNFCLKQNSSACKCNALIAIHSLWIFSVRYCDRQWIWQNDTWIR